MIKLIINFLVGSGFVALGFYFFVWQTDKVLELFGRIDFFDQYLGSEGGTRLGYKFIGIVIIFFGFLLTFSLFDDFALWAFSPLTKYTNPSAQVESINPGNLD